MSEATTLDDLSKLLFSLKAAKKRIVTTNGCFDILHQGHIQYLAQARSLGDILIVGVNSDSSVRQIKGADRPINHETDRAGTLAALRSVDRVVVFNDVLPNDFLSFVKPDIHCKGGDYDVSRLPEAEIVMRYGGEICIIPFVSGYSTSQLIDRIVLAEDSNNILNHSSGNVSNNYKEILKHLVVSNNVIKQIARQLTANIEALALFLIETLQTKHKILICGNGGSAADAQHFSGELIGRFRQNRTALPVIALTTDTSVITAVANDFGFEQIFSRQIEALGCSGDVLIAISTSGTSLNILNAIKRARSMGIKLVGLTGQTNPEFCNLVDFPIVVPTRDVAQIQQGCLIILHILCDLIEKGLIEG